MYYVQSSDGAKIAVYDLNPTSDKVIILIHGWPLSHKMFEYQTHSLIELGYRVISLDLRGFGESDETAFGYDYDQLATDLYYIVSTLDLDNFILVGFSVGGAIAIRYMSLYDGYGVHKLCLWNAAAPSYCKTAHNPYGQTLESTNKLISLGYNDRPSLNKYFGSIFFAREHPQVLKDWFLSISNNASGIGAMKTLTSLRDEDVFDDFKYVKVPTGIFHGLNDKICSYEMGKIQHNNIQNSKLFSFNNAGHGAFYDALGEFTNSFIDFIKN